MEINKFKNLVIMIDDFISEDASGDNAQKLIEYLIIERIGDVCYDMILDFVMKPYDDKDLIDLYLDAKRNNLFNTIELMHANFDVCMELLLDYVDKGLDRGHNVSTAIGTILDSNKNEYQIQLRFEFEKKCWLSNDESFESKTTDYIE